MKEISTEHHNVNANDVFDLPDIGQLAVVITYYNPFLYESRINNIERVLRWLHNEKLPTFGIELRSGKSTSRPPLFPENHPKTLQIDGESIFYRTDNLWNIMVNQLPVQFKYVLCIDSDVIIRGDGWAENLCGKLAKSKMVQPFSRAVWLDAHDHPIKEKMSAFYAYVNSLPNANVAKFYHPGFALAARREFWSKANGFYQAPLGIGANLLMSSVMGLWDDLAHDLNLVSDAFFEHCSHWSRSVDAWASGELDFVDCEIVHLWHGPTKKRKYDEQYNMLKGFNPKTDLVFNVPLGSMEWSKTAHSDKSEMIELISEYFGSRGDDDGK